MAQRRICFSIAGDFGAAMSFDTDTEVPYEELAKSVDKEKLAELLCLEALGYTASDIEIIPPAQYDEEFGEEADGE